ncbi:Undecaprenol kinase [Fusobacterium necrogenes]|uniref:Undecaprenol kinase n=1 Tax=Fusobacterium necrogenes TaxID=858 RepID=A0A377GXJ9_9FUSO|nr:diacylglycerol kinase [Fusobacterium necrogenes]STO31678.1 Undecaprenol kinase [Fusobacterium necrogenes]
MIMEERNKWKNIGITEKFNVAFEGIFETIRTERHMKFHCFCTIIVFIFSLFLDIGKYDAIAIIISVALIWLAELFNTAIESCVDMVTEKYHPLAKRAKDIAAGAVLITAINALFVGYIVFEKRIILNMKEAFSFLKASYQHTVLSIFVLIVVVVICIKAITGKGTALRGGFPSGHSALATSILTLVTALTDNPKIFFLTFILTVLVIHSRIEGKIHTFFETLIGAFLGWAITYLILILVAI